MNPDNALNSPTSMVVLPSDQNSQGYLLNGNQFPNGIITPLMLAATPIVANGDTYYSNGTTFVRLPVGSANQVLTASNGIPSWQTPTATPSLALVDTTHAYKIQFGQGTIVNSGGNSAGIAVTVTYPTAFTTIVGAWIGGGGIGGLNQGVVVNKTFMTADTITNSTFRALLASGDGTSVIINGTYYFNWQAIGY